MSVGEVHTFADGYSFRETEHGPLMKDTCVVCGAAVYSCQPTGRINQWGFEEDNSPTPARCSTCGRAHYGLSPF